MVDYPSRSPQTHYYGQSTAGPSSNDSRLTHSSAHRSSTNAGFWSSTSARTTYASYQSQPDAWEANYLSTVDDFKLFSFGRPDVDQGDERWKITTREGDETSSSSSDDSESRRRPRGRSRDITPRASVVSLDVSASRSGIRPRSHPSQLQQINYYHRGTGDSGNEDRENSHHYKYHHHPFELLDEHNHGEEMPAGVRSDFSIYSYDTGYDAASSYRSRSGTGSYAPSYTSSHARDRAEAEAEAISISSSRPASSAASGLALASSLDGDRHYHPDDLSISSTRRSLSFDEQYEHHGEGGELYDTPHLSNSDSERISLESATSSNMHLSVSSLRFDEERDFTLEQNEQAKNFAAPPNHMTDMSVSNLTWNQNAPSAPVPMTRLRSLSRSSSPSPSLSSASSSSAAHNALADFDFTYITSGLAFSANAMSQTSYMPHSTSEEKLDFVRSRSNVHHDDGAGGVRTEGKRSLRVERGVPMGWVDDFSIPTTPFNNTNTERKRARAVTVTAADGGASSTLPHTSAGTVSSSGTGRSKYGLSDIANSKDTKPQSRSPSQSRDTHSSTSPYKDLTALLDHSEINSTNGMPNVAQLHASSPSAPPNAVRRKRSAFASLGALAIGSMNSNSRTKETQATLLQPISPLSPALPVSPARTIKGEIQRTDVGLEKHNAEPSPDVSTLPVTLQHLELTRESPSVSRDKASTAVHPSELSTTPSSDPNLISALSFVPLSSSTNTSLPDGPSVHLPSDSPTVPSPAIDIHIPGLIRSYDDLTAPMVPSYPGMRREWVIRRERKVKSHLGMSETEIPETGKMGEDSDIKSDEQTKEADQGMLVGTGEVWENYLLGRFNVVRDDVSPKNRGKLNSVDITGSPKSGSGSGGSKGVDANVLGFRVPVGKPPQQRLIIKHLREEAQMGLSVVPDSSRPQIKYLNSTISTIPEDPSLASSKALNSGHPHEPTRPSSTLNSVPTVTPNRPSYRHDTQHPSILVHKHSKVAAFSISRQHRANSKESKESSSGRFHVIMLAPRDVQEAFTNTATTKKLGTVIDRHEAARAAFSPGDQTVKEKDGKKVKKTSSLYISPFKGKYRFTDGVGQVKSDGQIELDYRGTKSKELGQNAMKPPTPTKDTVSARDQVGTQSAPVYGRPYERTTAKTESERDDDLGNGKDRVATLPFERTGDGGQIMRIRTQNESQARENHKRAYGTLDYPPHSFTAPTAPSRPARILKRFLPWDLSLPSTSTSGHGTNSKATSSIGSATTTTQSVSTRDTTPTQSTGSDISIPYDPPWVTFISREQQEIQRNVFGQLEYSFEHVGLLPAKAKDKDRERPKNSSSTKRDRLHEASILPKVHKKSDVLSIVPADAFFMLLPLWPAETDVHSQRLSPFDIPLIPVESRKYLLVFYKPLQMEKPSKDSTIYDSRLKILLAGFRAIARQVSYQDLQGTGVRLPEQGISVSGPLEDAFTQIPGLSDTTSETGAATSTTVPISTSASTSQLSVIASSYSRDAGLEFDPEALIELDLCRVLNSKENANATGNEPLSEGIHEEQIDTEQSMMVRLTPIGNAVMEMVWVGGLALSSFGS